MRIKFALLSALGGISISLFANFLFPVIPNYRLSFGGLVVFLLVSGIVLASIAMREVFRL